MVMSKYENDKRSMKYGHSSAILDTEVTDYMSNFKYDINTLLQTDSFEYIEQFLKWINNGNNHTIVGLEDFKYAVYSNGTTEGFEKFYWNNQNRRFRCFKGEYLYHKIAWRDWNWNFIEDADLDSNDAVVISFPFADTGCEHSQYKEVMLRCEELGIPVLIDACYFGISKGMKYDFRYSCITDITFSLSKVFPVAHARIGLRLTRYDTDDLLMVYHKHSYNNRFGAALGLYLMKQFSSDFIYNKYRSNQVEFCNVLGVKPSDTVVFGIGGDEWAEYNRGAHTSRLGLQKYLHLPLAEFKKQIDEN